MAARKTTESQLAELRAIEHDPASEEGSAILRAALGSRSNFVVARAAEIVGEWQLTAYGLEMAAAFDQFMIDPLRRDPTCAAKRALAETCLQTEYSDEALFLSGIHHRQLEPVYGGREDTAAALRATCAVALSRLGYADTLLELARLLADPELDARLGAVQAVPYATQAGGVPLLWYKTLIGDAEPAVLMACFGALLQMVPDDALSLVGGYLADEDPAVAESAALALGESRLPSALAPLQAGREQADDPAVGRTILLAIGLLRTEPAVDYLLALLQDGVRADRDAALAALELFRYDEAIWGRVEAVTARR